MSGYQDHKICDRCGRRDLDPLEECSCPARNADREGAVKLSGAVKRESAPQADNGLRHGHARHGRETPTYNSWCAMKTRCLNPNRDNADRYTDRGITICDRWLIFDYFLADMGERPAGTTLDRMDNDKGYEPGNCRWATPTEQARNTRHTILTFDKAVEIARRRLAGETCRVIAAAYGISESLPREIVKGRAWKGAVEVARG